jgi:predicted ABC-class ATPase
VNRGETAQVDYVADVIRLDDHARELPNTMALTKRIVRQYAAIAYRAGKAEYTDPEPRVRQCGVCRGIRECDWAVHLEAM